MPDYHPTIPFNPIAPTARNAVNLTGKQFDRLTVLGLYARNKGSLFWICLCTCGRVKAIVTGSLVSSKVRSCGCLKIEAQTRHGLAKKSVARNRTYATWMNIKSRCSDIKNPYYGGRGIQVCERWQSSFAHFLADMGMRPSSKHSIDRIDNNGDYEPSNCRWATAKTQSHNRSTTRIVVFQGIGLTITDHARRVGLSPSLVRNRLSRGWTLHRALTTDKLPPK